MPVVFSSSADANFPTGRTFFVLTQVGDNITLGNYRGGSAITAAGSTSPTIVQIGFPSLDLGGTNSAQAAITSSTFSQLDVEDPSAAVVYIENGNGVTLDISEVIQGSNYIHFTSRQSQWISLGGESGALTIDIDGFNPGTHRLINPRITCTAGGALGNNNGAAGIYYDYTNGIWGISLNSGGPSTVDLVHRGGQGGYLAPLVCMGQAVVGWGGSGGFTLNPSLAGCFVTNNAGAQSYTLPALASAFGLTGNGGLRFEVTNIGAGTATISASSAILYGSGSSAKTHCAIPQGASATFTADAGDGVWLVSGAIGCTIT
jgi:hypothetical protein